jgi:hypothetical protein
VEEVVVHARPVDAEDLGPHAGEGALGEGAWRDVGGTFNAPIPASGAPMGQREEKRHDSGA